MTLEQLRAATDLANALAWPLVVLAALIYFAKPLRRFLENASEISFKAAGVEASARRQIAVAAALGAARAQRGEVADEGGLGIAETVSQTLTPARLRRMERASLLWVDDQPANNVFERRALGQAGIRVVTSPSTEDALNRLAGEPFDLVVTDMGRPGDERAGYSLLAAIRSAGRALPVIIYSFSGGLPAHRAQAHQAGAFGSTHDPEELLRLVAGALGTRADAV